MKSRMLVINLLIFCIMLTGIPAYAAGDTGGGTQQASNCTPLNDNNVSQLKMQVVANGQYGDVPVYEDYCAKSLNYFTHEQRTKEFLVKAISDSAKATVHDINERINCFDNNVNNRLDKLLKAFGI